MINNQRARREFTKTIIPFDLVGYEVIITNLRYALVGYLSLQIPGGVLRYISDGDVRSPFLGLKFAI